MKHWKNTILSAALLAVLTATPAHALEYTMERRMITCSAGPQAMTPSMNGRTPM